MKKKFLALALSLLAAFCLSCGLFNFTKLATNAYTNTVTYDGEKGETVCTLDEANAGDSKTNGLKKLFDYWNDSVISFTENGVLGAPESGSNIFNLMGIFPVANGNRTELELSIPLRNASTGEFIDAKRRADNVTVNLYEGTTGVGAKGLVASFTFWGNNYGAEKDYITASASVGTYKQDNINVPKRVMEEGGSVKIGFSAEEGWLVETASGYAALPVTDEYRAQLNALEIEEITRIQCVRELWSTGDSDYPLAVIKSVNSQSFIPQDNRLALTDLWAASAIKTAEANYTIGREYTFTLNATGVYNNLDSAVQPADAYMYFFADIVGDIGWNKEGQKGTNALGGIYVSVTAPSSGKTLIGSYLNSWGHIGSESIVFSFKEHGKNVLEIRLATNDGYAIVRTIEIDVAPAIVVEGEVIVEQGVLIAPAHKLIGSIGGAELSVSSSSIKVTYNGAEIEKQGEGFLPAGKGKYVFKYTCVFNGTEYTCDHEFYFDGIVYRYSVNVYGNGAVLPAEGTVEAGQSVSITIAPASGYEIEKVLVNGAETAVVDGVVTIENVLEDITADVYFKTIESEIGQGGEENKKSGCRSSVSRGAGMAVAALCLLGTLVLRKGARKHR